MSFSQIELHPHEHEVTPFFKHLTVEDVPASEREGKMVMKTIEVCELRFAGDNRYQPAVPVDAMYRRDGIRVITYAERFSDQYRKFLAGDAQETSGTALEELTGYGITPQQLSLCRALKIYSIEAMFGLEGPRLKSLGMHANDLKAMAVRFMEDRSSGAGTQRELEDLRRQVAELRGQQSAPALINDEVPLDEAPDEFAHLSDADLKTMIRDRSGQTPRGNPSRATLIAMIREG